MEGGNVAEDVGYYAGSSSREEMLKKITLAIEEVIFRSKVKGFKHNPTRISEMETAVYWAMRGSPS